MYYEHFTAFLDALLLKTLDVTVKGISYTCIKQVQPFL